MNTFISVPEAARLLGVSHQQVYKLCKERQIPHVRLGARIVLDPARLQAWIDQHTVDVVAAR